MITSGFGRTIRPEAVDWLVEEAGLSSGSRVLDLGAGTGNLTRVLVAKGLDVVAVEPSAAMRAKITGAAPTARVLDGTAESIPLLDSSVDCVTVAHAFHHFRADAALPEIHRVLRMGDSLALFWNVYAAGGPIKVELDRILHRHIDRGRRSGPPSEAGLRRSRRPISSR